MKRNTTHRAIAMGSLLIGSTACLAQDPIHRRYTTADGLASNTVYGVAQDSRGYLWFGTDAGVSRFDGHHFVNYGQREGLPDEEVLHCYEDSQHRLWLLMLNGRLAYILNDTLHHPGNDAMLRAVSGRSGWARACEDAEGNMWFGGVWGELLKLDRSGRSHRIDLSAVGQTGGNVTPLRGPDGAFYIQVNSTGFVVDHDSLEHTFTFAPPGPNPVYTTSGDGRLWAVAAEGLIGLGRQRGPLELSAAQCGPWDRARSLVIPEPGVLIYGRWDHGAMIVDTRNRTQRSVFTQETINSVRLDDEGNCWFTTAGGGVLSFTMGQMGSRILEEAAGMPIGPATCFHVDAHAVLWAGTESGHLLRIVGDRTTVHDLRMGDTRVQRVRALCDDGRSLFATTDLLTIRIPLLGDGPMTAVGAWDRMKDTLSPIAPMKVLLAMHDGSLVGAFYELMRSTDRDAPLFLPFLDDPLGYGRFHFLYEDPGHVLWVQRNDMLYTVRAGKLDTLEALRPFSSGHVTGMAALSDGTLAMGTMGHGILFLREGEVVLQLRQADGLPDDRCMRLRASGDTLVVATMEGTRLVIVELLPNAPPRTHVEDPGTDHVPTSDAVLMGGEVYAATARGICITHASVHGDRPRAPRAYISRITSNDLTLPPRSYFQLDHDHAALVVDIDAVSLAPTTRAEYQYRLDDAGVWTTSGTNSLTLLAQEAGEHVLQARVRVNGSLWSNVVSTRFAVLPPWWERLWFRLPAAFFGAALCYLLLRNHARRRYERRLELLRQREALVDERKRIAMDLHDDLGADLSGTTMLAEAALQNGQDTRPALEGMIARVRGMMPKVDEIIWALDSKNDTLSSLFAHLERSAKARTAAMKVRLEFVGPWAVDELIVNSDFRRVVLMLVKESVNNALKHSQCDQIELSINMEGGRLVILVQDNGKGMVLTPAARSRHGLSNMQDRARQFNGTVGFADVKPHGTCVTIELPLPVDATGGNGPK